MNGQDASSESLEIIEDHLSVVAAGHPMVKHGSMFEELCDAFQGRAIFFLLNDLNYEHYRFNLERSLQARCFYLRKLSEQGAQDSVYTALSRTNCLFAAIAIEEHEAMFEIERMSAQRWMRDGEYKEDYSYHKAILTLLSHDRASARPYLDAMTAALDGIADNRLSLLQAYIENDATAFWAAFDDFLEERLDRDSIDVDGGLIYYSPWTKAFQYLSLEAVSWLKLANRSGFTPPKDAYVMCPSAALASIPKKPFPNVFLEIEKEFGL